MKKDKIKYSLVTDLSDKELINVLLDPFSIKDEDRKNIIKEVLYLLDRNRVIYLSTLKKIEGLPEEACHTLLAALMMIAFVSFRISSSSLSILE